MSERTPRNGLQLAQRVREWIFRWRPPMDSAVELNALLKGYAQEAAAQQQEADALGPIEYIAEARDPGLSLMRDGGEVVIYYEDNAGPYIEIRTDSGRLRACFDANPDVLRKFLAGALEKLGHW